ncbi:MAG TPA: chemotaxis protein CheW [Cyanothece sp. UBA12306]|nr:chemotaxis protein CheW [Cyanothece sp. UBA12306]
MQQEYFSVELSGSVHLAFPLEDLVKVIEIKPKNLYLMPGMAPFWLGVINHQGNLLWVLDSEDFFDLEQQTYKSKSTLKAVILQKQIKKNQRRLALTVDKLQGIISLDNPESLSVSSSLPSFYQPFIKGTIFGQGTAIDILELEQFFSVVQTAKSVKTLT